MGKIINILKKIFVPEISEPDIKNNVMTMFSNIKEVIFNAVRSDEQIIGYLKGNNKIVLEISIKDAIIKIQIAGT